MELGSPMVGFMLLVSMAKSYVLHGLLLRANSRDDGMTREEQKKMVNRAT